MEEQILSLPERRPSQLAYGLGMTDHAFDRRGLFLERTFKGVDVFMDTLDAQPRIDAAVKIDDFAFAGLAHPYVVHVADMTTLGGELGQGHRDRLDPLRRCFAARGVLRLQRLYMRFDLDAGSQFGRDRAFKSVGHF